MTSAPQPTATIYLDADACPVKDVVYKVTARYGVPLKVVANGWLRIPDTAGLAAEMVTVPGSPDAADDWIAERATPGDLVLTADIPLGSDTKETAFGLSSCHTLPSNVYVSAGAPELTHPLPVALGVPARYRGPNGSFGSSAAPIRAANVVLALR